MTTIVYSRSSVRENQLWNPFLYSIPFSDEQIADRVIVYGIYSGSNNNDINYLYDIETEKLAWLLSEYNSKIEQLTADEASLLIKIAAEEYISRLKIQAISNKIDTKTAQNSAESSYLDAQYASAMSDREVLITKQKELMKVREESDIKIAEIETQAIEESIRQADVDNQIAKQEIERIKLEVETAKISMQVLEFQQKINEIALQILEIIQKERDAETDISEIRSRILKLELIAEDLDIEEAERDLLEYQADNEKDAKQALIDAQIQNIRAETSSIKSLTELVDNVGNLDIEEIKARTAAMVAELEAKLEISSSIHDAKIESIEADVSIASGHNAIDITNVGKRNEIDAQHISEAISDYNTAISVARIMAFAEIKNTLTHSIQRA